MSQRYTEWRDAQRAAAEMATRLNLDVAIRFVKEYGNGGYNVSLACRNDSDYTRAQIVHPGDPA